MPNLDNPGGGNCGFYAFGIGLIDAIQKEYSDAETSPTLDKLNSSLEPPISIQDILDFDLKDYGCDCSHYKREFLDNFQVILRNKASLGYIKELKNSVLREIAGYATQIEGTTVFNKFKELVDSKINSTSLSSQFNELALSPMVIKLADSVLRNLSFKGRTLSLQEFQRLDSIEQVRVINTAAKAIFLGDVFDGSEPKTDSAILQATNVITQSGYWATDQDLRSIATELDINLNINGHENGQNKADVATITLNNISNDHWTTEVETIPGFEERFTKTVIEQDISQLTPLAQKILLSMISAVESSPQREQFKKFIYLLIQSAEDFNVKPAHKINPDQLDSAEAVEGQSHEEFVQSLQEAEFRKVGLKR